MGCSSRLLVLVFLATITLPACGPLVATEIDLPTPTMMPSEAEQQALCPPKTRYIIEPVDINRPISECRMYFYVRFIKSDTEEKWFQLVIQRGQPITVEDGYPIPSEQVFPYWYRWVVRGTNGDLHRAWLAYFIRGRDGLYHTIVSQPPDEWPESYLEIYFEDINNDGVDEDVTFEVPLVQFLPIDVP